MNIVVPEEVGLSSTRLRQLKTMAQDYIDQGKLAGLITLVARHGQVAHFESYGYMDVEAGKPMLPGTIFRIYSMSKPIASFALMMLVEEGHIALDDSVTQFIPEFKALKVFVGTTERGIEIAEVENKMTIRHLFTHTSGLTYDGFIDTPVAQMYRDAGLFDDLRILQVSLPEMIKTLAEFPLVFQPGSGFRYSVAHDVIGYLVSILSDMPFDAFLEERIFKPLGMADTGFYVPKEKLDRFAAMYSAPEEGGIHLLDTPGSSQFTQPDRPPSGGVGLVSTVSDYLHFAQMVLNGGELNGIRLLSHDNVQLMTSNQLSDNLLPVFSSPGLGYGLGFGVHVGTEWSKSMGSQGAFSWLGHGGTAFLVDPQKDLIGIVMPQALHYYEPQSILGGEVRLSPTHKTEVWNKR